MVAQAFGIVRILSAVIFSLRAVTIGEPMNCGIAAVRGATSA